MALRIFGKDDVSVNKKSPGGPIKLDAVMIVKNEEKNIGRCLESLQGLVDEVFIEDTGSTDKTIEIAESHQQYKILLEQAEKAKQTELDRWKKG